MKKYPIWKSEEVFVPNNKETHTSSNTRFRTLLSSSFILAMCQYARYKESQAPSPRGEPLPCLAWVFQFPGLFFSVHTLVSSHLISLVSLTFSGEYCYCLLSCCLLLLLYCGFLALTSYSLLCLCISTLPVGENELLRE